MASFLFWSRPFSFCLCFKTSPRAYENEFDLHENERAGEMHFHMNGFARRLVLTQRQNQGAKGNSKFPSRQEKIKFSLVFCTIILTKYKNNVSTREAQIDAY